MNVYESDDSEPDEEFIPIAKPRKKRTTASSTVAGSVAEPLPELKYSCSKEGCTERFGTKKELKNHKDAASNHEYCRKCDRDFADWDKLQYHLIKSPLHIICVECMKEFKSQGGLAGHTKQMHRNPLPVDCPGCHKNFKSASGLTQHVENDLCTGGVRRVLLAGKLIAINDFTNEGRSLQTKDNKLVTTSTHIWREGVMREIKSDLDGFDENDPALIELRPAAPDVENLRSDMAKVTVLDYTDSIQGVIPKVSQEELEKCWNQAKQAYVCYHRGCKKSYPAGGGINGVHAITQHLSSAVHAPKRFRCPTCLDRFKSSSALLQHVESGSCNLGNSANAYGVTELLTGGLVKKQKNENGEDIIVASYDGWDMK